MRVVKPALLEATHPDYAVLNSLRVEINKKSKGKLEAEFPLLVREAVDFVLDPVNTARTRVSELDNVEKTFIGLKLEHFVRNLLDVPKQLRDLHIGGLDVDIKNTIGNNWSIPQETYRNSEPCLLMAIDDLRYECYLGLVLAKREYLHDGKGNRDTKRGISAAGFQNILWLASKLPFPPSKFDSVDMNRFRELRNIRGGTKRAVQFFRENLRTPIHRTVVHALLFDQRDYMKRLRGNGGARDILRTEGVAVVSSYHNGLIKSMGLSPLLGDEVMAVSGLTNEEALRLVSADAIDA